MHISLNRTIISLATGVIIAKNKIYAIKYIESYPIQIIYISPDHHTAHSEQSKGLRL